VRYTYGGHGRPPDVDTNLRESFWKNAVLPENWSSQNYFFLNPPKAYAGGPEKSMAIIY
jgi:hypothetical protein